MPQARLPASLTQTAKTGLLVVVGGGLGKVTAFITLLVLAWFIPPKEFGLIGLATVLIGLVDVLTQTGAREYIIQRPKARLQTIRYAYFIEIVRGMMIAACISAIAIVLLLTQGIEEKFLVVLAMALIPAMNGATNIAVFSRMRHLDFRASIALDLVGPVFGLIVGVALAIALQNVWALVAARVCDSGARLVASHLLLKTISPAIRVSRIGVFFKFSSGVFAGAILSYGAMNLPLLLLLLFGSEQDLGFLIVALSFANLATTHIAKPVSKVIFAALSRHQGDSGEHASFFSDSYAAVLRATAPVCVTIIFMASRIEEIAFAASWSGIGQIIALLSAGALIRLCWTSGSGLFWSVGRTDIPAKLAGVFLASGILAALVYWLLFLQPTGSMSSIDVSRIWAASTLPTFVAWLAYTKSIVGRHFRKTLADLVIVFSSCALIFFLILSLDSMFPRNIFGTASMLLVALTLYLPTLYVKTPTWLVRSRS